MLKCNHQSPFGMKIFWLAAFSLAFWGSPLLAQQVDFNHYRMLKTTGTLPDEFSSTVYKHSHSGKKKSKNKKTDEEEFELKSAYSLDRFMRSGSLVFNDPVSAYIEKVFNEVLRANGIEDKIHCHLIRSTAVNAYAINQNRVFVTAGLIAQLTSEAQLAFILSHEFIHYRNRHAMEGYKNEKNVERNYKRYRSMSYADKEDILFRYSRELEMEADNQGTALYLKTNYSLQGPDQAFDVLQFGEYPFEEIPFEKSFLETRYLVFPKGYFLDKVDEIVAEEEDDRDEESSTHPNLQRRRSEVTAIVGSTSGEGRKDFIVSEEEFNYVRKICRFELCRMYLQEREYERALYSAYILLQEDSTSLYLQKTVSKALYGLSTYANSRKFSKVHNSSGSVAGNEQQVNSLMDNLTNEELTLTALNYTWRVHQQYPDDKETKLIADELFSQVVNKHSLSRFSLKTAPRDTSVKKEEPVDTVQQKPKKNKYASIKTKSSDDKKNKKKDDGDNFIHYGFVDLLEDKEFTERFDYHWDRREDRLDKEEEEDDYTSDKKNRKSRNKYSEDRTDLDEEIEKLVLFDPYSLKIDLRKNKNDLYQATAKKREKFIDNLEMLTKSAGIKNEIIRRNEVGSEDVDLYNEICLISDFLSERFEHDDKVTVLPVDYDELMKFSSEYGSPYVALPGSLLVVEERPVLGTAMNIMLGAVLWPYLPYAIYRAATPRYVTVMYLAVYNVETGKLSFADVVEIASKDGSDLVNSQIYDMLIRMKSKN